MLHLCAYAPVVFRRLNVYSSTRRNKRTEENSPLYHGILSGTLSVSGCTSLGSASCPEYPDDAYLAECYHPEEYVIFPCQGHPAHKVKSAKLIYCTVNYDRPGQEYMP